MISEEEMKEIQEIEKSKRKQGIKHCKDCLYDDCNFS